MIYIVGESLTVTILQFTNLVNTQT